MTHFRFFSKSQNEALGSAVNPCASTRASIAEIHPYRKSWNSQSLSVVGSGEELGVAGWVEVDTPVSDSGSAAGSA